MVPPAISIIHCHLRWDHGSLWHWPLTDPAFFSEWWIMLIGTPLSDIRMCCTFHIGWLEELAEYCHSLQTGGEKLHHVLSPPRGRRLLCSLDLPLRVFVSSASLHFISHLQTKTDTTCSGRNLSWVSSSFLLMWFSFSEHGPFVFVGLSCKVNLILEYVYFTAHLADEFQIQ